MSLKKFFNKIFDNLRLGAKRYVGPSLATTSEEKLVGNNSENEVFSYLRELLPNAAIYRNVCLDEKLAKDEIDLLVIYCNKVFVIEIKSWRGKIYKKKNNIYQEKESKSGETYTTLKKDPFQQVKRNTNLIRAQFPNIWFNSVVLFQDVDDVHIKSDIKWCCSLGGLVNFIKTGKNRQSGEKEIKKLIHKIKCYDLLISTSNSNKEESCIIDELCLHFKIGKKDIYKKDIYMIKVNHHFTFDDITIILKDKKKHKITKDYQNIVYKVNGEVKSVSISKVDRIIIGYRFNAQKKIKK